MEGNSINSSDNPIPLSVWSDTVSYAVTRFPTDDNASDNSNNTSTTLSIWSDIIYEATQFPMEANHSSDNSSNTTSTLSVLSAILTTQTLKRVYWVICCFGFLSNVFVVIIIALSRPMRKQTTNRLIANQSLMDATIAVFLFLTTLYENDGQTVRRVPGQLADELLCRLWFTKMPLWGMLLSSMYAMVTLTLERFLAVVYPIWHKTKFAGNTVVIGLMIGTPWLFGPLFYVSFVTPTAKIFADGRCAVYSVWPNVLTRRAVGVFTVVIQFLTPLTILIYCYTRMAVVLQKRVEKTTTVTVAESSTKPREGGQRRNESMARARSNVIKTLTIVGVCYVLCWTWNQVHFLLFSVGYYPDINLSGDIYSITVILVFMNCCTNPVIYTVSYKQFQKGIRRLICRGRVEDEGACVVEAVTDTTK